MYVNNTPCYCSSVLLFRMNLNIHARKKKNSLSFFVNFLSIAFKNLEFLNLGRV